ncbi:MAG: cytochrome c1 [Hyphomicrobium sp.]
MTTFRMKTLIAVAGVSALLAGAMSARVLAAGEHGAGHEIERQHWSFSGFKGRFDTAQLQRGFQVFQEKCAACHGLSRVYFRNLVQKGGPEFPEDSVKELAKTWPNKIADGPDNDGNMFERDPKLSDPILGPFKNAKAAAAAMGAAPPDLSIMAKARNVHNSSAWPRHVFLDMPKDIITGYQEGGADYIYALLTGYPDAPPAGMELAPGMNYNTAFPGNQIAMPAPLGKDNFSKYQDGSGSLESSARDVAAFLSWAADPSLNARKSIGWQVMLYLLVTTGLLYVGKRRIWSKVH